MDRLTGVEGEGDRSRAQLLLVIVRGILSVLPISFFSISSELGLWGEKPCRVPLPALVLGLVLGQYG